ncbi:MAG: radical SAM protein, partial [Desulfatiglandales bacterium]
KPVVVWNVTKGCNLSCIHCYAQAQRYRNEDELSLKEGLSLIEDLASFGVPVVLFSGGEPLMRPEIYTWILAVTRSGMRAVLSTNGTLIDKETASKLRDLGLSYVGVSLDGLEDVNDRFRGKKGAFKEALKGIEECRKAGIKVGLRFTVNKMNYGQVSHIFDLIEAEDIPRVCFYHLVYAGRGSRLMDQDLTKSQTRSVVDLIMDRTRELFEKGMPKEVLTVDNHADGPYVYLRMKREGNPRAEEVLELLKMNEGNNSGKGIGCISWDGNVHADQFWRHYSFGNVRERPFSEIWTDLSNPLMAQLKDKKRYVKGRCSLCKWLDICAGNFRVRAEAATGDLWGE